MKIAVTSDLHGFLPEIEECDLLLICGDIMPLHYQCNLIASNAWLQTVFLPWCRDCPAKHVVFIAGNHDWFMERRAGTMKEIMQNWSKYNVYYLCNQSIEIDGLKIFGTPYCKQFGNWAFMRDNEMLKNLYAEIPEGLDILISHDAPDLCGAGDILERDPIVNAGNQILAEAIVEKKPKYAFCGHIHSGNHNLTKNGDTYVANVSYVNEQYEPYYPILCISQE